MSQSRTIEPVQKYWPLAKQNICLKNQEDDMGFFSGLGSGLGKGIGCVFGVIIGIILVIVLIGMCVSGALLN